MRQVAGKSYRIGEQNFSARWQLNRFELWVKGRKHARRFKHSGLGQSIKERALSRVGIADQRHCRHGNRFAPLALLSTHSPDGFEVLPYLQDAALNLTAIGFELRFTGPPRADAAAKLRHRLSAPGESRQHVFELRQFYLQLAFTGSCVPRKNVEDQLRSVKNAARQGFFKIAKLCRRQVVIEEDNIRVSGSRNSGQLFHLTAADQ